MSPSVGNSPLPERKLDRTRAALASLVAMAATVLVAACGGSSNSSAVAGGKSTSSGLGATGRTLVFLENETGENLDLDGPDGGIQPNDNIITNLYPPLVAPAVSAQGPDILSPVGGRYVGVLAKSWSHSGRAWTFTLRQGIRSCAGNELTSSDVVYSFSRAISLSGDTTYGYWLGNVMGALPDAAALPHAPASAKAIHGEVVATGPYTVRITQFAPLTNFLGPLSLFPIYDQKAMRAHATAGDQWSHNFVGGSGSAGFGDYCLGAWQKGVQTTLTANPYLPAADRPHFTEVKVEKVVSDAARIASLESGAAQAVDGLTPAEFSQVAASGQGKVLNWYGNLFLEVGLNYRFAPWSGGGNPSVARLLRQAVADAVPYRQIIKTAFYGDATKWNGLISSDFYGARSYPGMYGTDDAEARKLLAEAGYPGGRGLSGPGLTLTYDADQQSTLEPVATLLQSALKQIGISITLNPVPGTQFSTEEQNQHSLAFYILGTEVAANADTGYMMALQYVSKGAGSNQNSQNYDNPEFDRLFAEQKTLTGQARLTVLSQMQKILMTDLPRIPIAERATQMAVAKNIAGWSPNAQQGELFQTLTVNR
jgi:peptide/nickel transport system substrate-binding protein